MRTNKSKMREQKAKNREKHKVKEVLDFFERSGLPANYYIYVINHVINGKGMIAIRLIRDQSELQLKDSKFIVDALRDLETQDLIMTVKNMKVYYPEYFL